MEASKFYELEKLLKEFQGMLFKQEDRDTIEKALNVVKSEINDYEFEREEKIRQDSE